MWSYSSPHQREHHHHHHHSGESPAKRLRIDGSASTPNSSNATVMGHNTGVSADFTKVKLDYDAIDAMSLDSATILIE